MKPTVLDRIAEVLHALANRLTPIETDMADSAASQEQLSRNVAKMAESYENLVESYERLTELYLKADERADRIEAMVGNYVEATKELRVTSTKLISEVREKLKAAGA